MDCVHRMELERTPQYPRPKFRDDRIFLQEATLHELFAQDFGVVQLLPPGARTIKIMGLPRGNPDLVCMRAQGRFDDPTAVLFPIEIKRPIRLRSDNLVEDYTRQWQSGGEQGPVGPVRQIFGYMRLNGFRYGVLTTYEEIWFIKRTMQHTNDLVVSPTISSSGTGPTLLQCYLWFIRQAHDDEWMLDTSDVAQNRAIPYEGLSQSFRLASLASDIATSKPAWLSYMLHIGGLTFCGDSKKLQIPNLVAAERFGNATLDRLKLRLEDVHLAFQNIVSSGSVRQALALYKRTMEIRDVGDSDFKKTEENHRDSFHYALLGNSHPALRKIGLETHITKMPQKTIGRIDMLIQVPLKKRVLLLEWKAIQIDYLDFGTLRERKGKAEHLQRMVLVNDVLDLKFSQNDIWRAGQTIRSWIAEGPIRGDNKKSPRQQLAEYVASPEITKLKEDNEVTAYLVVVIGSCQVLFWEMDDGYFQKDPQLAA